MHRQGRCYYGKINTDKKETFKDIKVYKLLDLQEIGIELRPKKLHVDYTSNIGFSYG